MENEIQPGPDRDFQLELDKLEACGNLRVLPETCCDGKWIEAGGRRMLNLSSNDYLGLASDKALYEEFLRTVKERDLCFSSSSSRLLTGNFPAYRELETLLVSLFGAESALVFSSGYHMNTGILPAVTDANTLILADKLVHASLIDGIRLSAAKCIRYRHQDYAQLENLLAKYHGSYHRIVIVTESVFSMDGDVASLDRLVALKRCYDHVMLYVDEAHGIAVRGAHGLGVAEEQGCLKDIDFLCGTFGKAMASVGAYVVCRKVIRDYLVNRMRTLIFTTALPPVNVAWTRFVLSRLEEMQVRREHLAQISARLRAAVRESGADCPSESHIIPLVVGANEKAIWKALQMQEHGFYVLPVRPPTVPEGTARLRSSLTALIEADEVARLCHELKE